MDLKRIRALFLLALQLMAHFFLLFFKKRRGLDFFKKQYVAEGIPLLSSNLRNLWPEFSKCTSCRLCDASCQVANRLSSSVKPSYLIATITRNLASLALSQQSLIDCDSCNLQECQRACPESIAIPDLITALKSEGFHHAH